jgi:hypothetical protein
MLVPHEMLGLQDGVVLQDGVYYILYMVHVCCCYCTYYLHVQGTAYTESGVMVHVSLQRIHTYHMPATS